MQDSAIMQKHYLVDNQLSWILILFFVLTDFYRECWHEFGGAKWAKHAAESALAKGRPSLMEQSHRNAGGVVRLLSL